MEKEATRSGAREDFYHKKIPPAEDGGAPFNKGRIKSNYFPIPPFLKEVPRASEAEDLKQMKLVYNQNLKNLAKNLRNESTLSEVLLWKEIKGKKLGYQFLRQRPIGNYIVDFYCSKLNLAIEIDGVSHDAKINEDEARNENLRKEGVLVIHFLDRDVKNNLGSVVMAIKEYIAEIPPPRGLGDSL